VTVDATRKIITRNDSPDISFDRSINPYRGCEHGCIYCFARPTHAYLGHSAGLDFERQIYVKVNAVELLRRELADRKYRPKPIAMGTNTDPYQPAERKHRLTRGILEVMLETKHPVTITTKSALVVRDLDILSELALQQLDRIDLHIDLPLEIESCRMPEISVRRPCEAVRAPMLAAAIRIDRAVETDVRALVAGDDALGPLDMLDRLERLQILDLAPAVINGLAALRVEPARDIGLRAAAAIAPGIDQRPADQIGVACILELFELLELRCGLDRHDGLDQQMGTTRPSVNGS